jgi:hypothetical protein
MLDSQLICDKCNLSHNELQKLIASGCQITLNDNKILIKLNDIIHLNIFQKIIDLLFSSIPNTIQIQYIKQPQSVYLLNSYIAYITKKQNFNNIVCTIDEQQTLIINCLNQEIKNDIAKYVDIIHQLLQKLSFPYQTIRFIYEKHQQEKLTLTPNDYSLKTYDKIFTISGEVFYIKERKTNKQPYVFYIKTSNDFYIVKKFVYAKDLAIYSNIKIHSYVEVNAHFVYDE